MGSRAGLVALAVGFLVTLEPVAGDVRGAPSARQQAHTDPRSIDRLRELPAPRGLGRALVGSERSHANALIVLRALPGVWCGDEIAGDDTTHEVNNGDYRYHGIYAVPSDGMDRFNVLAASLQADAFQASALLERLYARAIRFDMGTRCGASYLDMSVVRLHATQGELKAAGQAGVVELLRLVGDDLRAAGFDPLPQSTTREQAEAKRKSYLVWLDAPGPKPGVCGMGSMFTDTTRAATNFNNYGGKVAVVFRAGEQFCNSNTVRHEIGHNLGALQPGAPSAFDGAHCNDAYEDSMCYPSAPRRGGGDYESEYFDYGNDDYWDPPGGALERWTVNLNQFLCPDVACNVPSGGSGVDRLADALTSATGGLLGSCTNTGFLIVGGQCPGNSSDPTTELARTAPPPPRILMRVRRLEHRRWRITLQLLEGERALVDVSCRRGRARRRVLRRMLSGSKPMHATVRCDGKPRATVKAT